MEILVLGGSGFVGGHLARRLSRDGHAVRVGTRYAPAARQARLRRFRELAGRARGLEES